MGKPVYIEKTVVASLKASSEVSSICAGRIYHIVIPQGKDMPAVVYQRTYSSPDYTLGGYGSESVLLMINSFALTYEVAKSLALAVRAVMAGDPLNSILQNEADIYEQKYGVFCVSAEYRCQQTGGYCHG